MTDIFDAKIMCKNCNREMQAGTVKKAGAELRAMICQKCGDKIIHPADLNCLNKFNDLKGKTFSVKMRMVGNSHAISIPKEIFDFLNERHKDMHSEMSRMQKEMEDMVRLSFDNFDKISLSFGGLGFDEDEDEDEDSEDDYVEERRVRERARKQREADR